MALAEWNQEVQALAPQASAQPFTYGVGPGRPNRSSKYSHSEVRHMPVEFLGEDAVPVMDHKSVRTVCRKCLPELLQRPFRRRVGGDVVMENPPRAQFQDHTDIQGAERCRDHE